MRTFLFPFAASLLAACSSSPASTPPADGGVADDGADQAITVSLTSPVDTVYTNGKITVQVVARGTPTRVSLEKNGLPLADLVAPFTYVWDTTTEAEASYELRAVASGGGVTVRSEPRTVIVDRTPPKVIARVPAPGASTVSVTDPVRMTFSEPIAPSTLTDASFAVLDGPGHALARTLDVDPAGTTVTARFASPVVSPATLEAHLTTAITDRAGNGLVVPPDAWTFTLPEWLALGAPLGTASTLSVVAANAGSPVVAWEESTGAGRVEHVTGWDGAKWSEIDIGEAPTPRLNSSLPQLVADPTEGVDILTMDADPPYARHLVQWRGGVATSLFTQAPWSGLGDVSELMSFGFDEGGGALATFSYSLPTTRRWDGHAWEVFGLESGLGGSVRCRLVDASGQALLVTSAGNATALKVIVYASEGTNWTQLGDALTFDYTNIACVGSSRSSLRILVPSSANDAVSVWQWGATSWAEAPGDAASVPDVRSFGGAVRGSDGALYVAGYGAGTSAALVRKWAGTSWLKLGPTPVLYAAALTVDGKGVPYVAGLTGNDGGGSSLVVLRHNE